VPDLLRRCPTEPKQPTIAARWLRPVGCWVSVSPRIAHAVGSARRGAVGSARRQRQDAVGSARRQRRGRCWV